LVNVSSSPVTQQDVKDWWEAFLASNHEVDVSTGLVKNGDNRIFLYAQDERDIPSSRTPLRGRVDLKAENASKVQKIIWPVITTAGETPDFAAFETAVTEGAYSYLRPNVRNYDVKQDGGLTAIPFSRVAATAASGDEPNYDGLWCCISTEGLSKGDTIEFGSRGTRDFTAKAIWEINI
jgi:hypothetical protein